MNFYFNIWRKKDYLKSFYNIDCYSLKCFLKLLFLEIIYDCILWHCQILFIKYGAKACMTPLGKILQEGNALGFVLLSNCVLAFQEKWNFPVAGCFQNYVMEPNNQWISKTNKAHWAKFTSCLNPTSARNSLVGNLAYCCKIFLKVPCHELYLVVCKVPF